FVVSWYSDGQDGDQGGIYAQRYNAAGGTVGSEFRANTLTTGSQSFPSVAVGANGDFVISWISDSDGDSTGIDAQAFNAAGVAQGGQIQFNTYTTQLQELPIVAADAANDFVVVWDSFGQDGDDLGAYGQRFHDSLPPKVQSTSINGGAAQRSRVTSVTVNFDS